MKKFLNRSFQICTNILVILVTILIIFSLYNIFSIKFLHRPYTSLMGYSLFEIATGSMEPTINVKDVIIVKITKDVQVGDIVTYQEGNNLITHRVVGIKDDNIITKGDANNSIDVMVDRNNIVGKTIHIIRKGGIIREIFITPKVIISIIVMLLLINCCLSINDNKNKKCNDIKFDKYDVKNSDEVNKKEIYKIVKIDDDINKDINVNDTDKEIDNNDNKSFQDIKNKIENK